MEFLWHLEEKVDLYWGVGALGLLFCCACFYFFQQKNRTEEMKIHLWYILLVLFAAMNPLSLFVIDISGNMGVYERLFWLLLSPALIALAFSDVISKKKKMLIPCVLLIIMCGKIVFTDTEYKDATHAYKIDSQAIEVSDIIIRHHEKLPADAKVVTNRMNYDAPSAMVTEPLCEDIRMYNANIKLLYVRKNFGSATYDINKKTVGLLSLENDKIPLKYITRRMKKRNFNYLVIGDWQWLSGDMSKYPLELIGQTANYKVYYYDRERLMDGQYRVTQYADKEGYQALCYTIEDSKGRLIVIDGGRAWQSLDMVDIIKEKGGRVDYWIITHPHDDHAGVLASVLEAAWDKSEIEIGQILIGEMDEEAVMAQGLRTDAYQYLLNNLKQRDNVTWLKAGDTLDVLGLRMDVLHTCNETVVKYSDNILNDGSMVFKLSAKRRSFLFLGDIGDNSADTAQKAADTGGIPVASQMIAQEMMDNYGELLPSTYVQMAHHGNSTLPDEFYRMINPNRAYFDAPDWLMENRNKDTGEESYYTTPHYKELMESLGAKIHSYNTAPNTILLK